MKKLFITIFSFLIVFNLSIESIEAQSDNTQLYVVNSTTIDPSKKAAYEEAVKDFNASLKSANLNNLEWYASSTDSYEYHFGIPIDNLAQLDKSFFGEAFKVLGEKKFKELRAALNDCVNEEINTIFYNVPAHNYRHPSLDNTKMNFRHWTIYEFKVGTNEDVFALVMEWNALLKKHDVVRRQSVYMGSLGTKVGTMVILTDAKDRATYVQQQTELFEKTGEEGRALWARTEALIKKIEQKTGRIRRDLSLITSMDETTKAGAKQK